MTLLKVMLAQGHDENVFTIVLSKLESQEISNILSQFEIRLYNPETGEKLEEFFAHEKKINRISFNLDNFLWLKNSERNWFQ